MLTRAAVWGECTHVFHMHCLLKWIGTASSKQQCPMDRRPWGACGAACARVRC
jgi:anaphase-promoting complex subunit 11